jgi:hypothetical protein
MYFSRKPRRDSRGCQGNSVTAARYRVKIVRCATRPPKCQLAALANRPPSASRPPHRGRSSLRDADTYAAPLDQRNNSSERMNLRVISALVQRRYLSDTPLSTPNLSPTRSRAPRCGGALRSRGSLAAARSLAPVSHAICKIRSSVTVVWSASPEHGMVEVSGDLLSVACPCSWRTARSRGRPRRRRDPVRHNCVAASR